MNDKEVREIAEKMIADGRALAEKAAMMITNAETELAELDKPVLRHGSFLATVDTPPQLRIALYDISGDLHAFDVEENRFKSLAKDTKYTVLDEPTIFDDLAVLSEPLKKFEVYYSDSNSKSRPRICAKLIKTGDIELTVNGGYFTDTIEKFTEFHQKLGRLIATAKLFTGAKGI